MRLTVSYKIALLVALLIVALGIAQIFVGLRLLIPSFDALELDNAHVDMDRVADALRHEIDALSVATRDYGDWKELYRFMDDRDPRDVAALSRQQFQDLNVDVLILFDAEGKMVWSLGSPPGSSAPRALDASAPPADVARRSWRQVLEAGSSAEGILSTADGPLLASIAPILDGQGGGPARGGVLLGRYLTAAQVGKVAQQAHVKVGLIEERGAGEVPADHDVQRGATAGALHRENDTMIERENVTEVYRGFPGVDGRAAFSLRAEVPRTISRHGRRIVMFATLSLTIIGALILGLLLITLRRMVLAPLAHLTNHAIAIGRQDGDAMRLNIDRSDEIGVLAQEFDCMMERLAAVRGALVERSFEAGVGEMASGALHNIGNAITPLTVRIENLGQRLRAAPIADVEPTLAALARSRDDVARHADCEALLGMLAREYVQVIDRSEQELQVIRRQLDDVKQVLSEQKRFARRGPVVEEISVEGLVRQAAEVIPEELRASLKIEIAPSLSAIGSRPLPRVALQQVLQNILLNAAEAIRDRGAGGGTVAVNAWTVSRPGSGDDSLELTITDDGAGIAQESLSRLFERGFTTKSRATNSGSGLHWCANTLIALGGSIDVQSAGTGRGACFRVRVPTPGFASGVAEQAA